MTHEEFDKRVEELFSDKPRYENLQQFILDLIGDDELYIKTQNNNEYYYNNKFRAELRKIVKG